MVIGGPCSLRVYVWQCGGFVWGRHTWGSPSVVESVVVWRMSENNCRVLACPVLWWRMKRLYSFMYFMYMANVICRLVEPWHRLSVIVFSRILTSDSCYVAVAYIVLGLGLEDEEVLVNYIGWPLWLVVLCEIVSCPCFLVLIYFLSSYITYALLFFTFFQNSFYFQFSFMFWLIFLLLPILSFALPPRAPLIYIYTVFLTLLFRTLPSIHLYFLADLSSSKVPFYRPAFLNLHSTILYLSVCMPYMPYRTSDWHLSRAQP